MAMYSSAPSRTGWRASTIRKAPMSSSGACPVRVSHLWENKMRRMRGMPSGNDTSRRSLSLRPKVFVAENVPEFLKSEQFGGMEAACKRGERLEDYEIEHFVLDSSLYGAPQKRRRAIVIGRRRGHPPLGKPPESVSRSNVRDAFDGLRREVRVRDLPDRITDFPGYRVQGPFIGEELHITRSFTHLSMQRYLSIPAGGNRFDIPYHLLAPCWRTHRTGSGDVMGRMWWDKPSVTIRTEFYKPEKGRYLHPTEHRPITHLEAARLQGFPDDYKWFGSKYSIARQIGNAVPLQLGHALGCHILLALSSWSDHHEKAAA